MEQDNRNVWSHYHAIHEFAQSPIHSVINLCGGSKKY